MTDLFDAAAMYDEDYLHFFAVPRGPGETAEPEPTVRGADPTVDLIWRLLDLRPGMSVLDLACGDGKIANGLAARGCLVTGLDSSAVFLDRRAPTRLPPVSASTMWPETCATFRRQVASTGW